MQLNRRTACQIIGSIPFLGWIDPIRSIVNTEAAIHYRAKGDGRSLYKLLRDHIRNGIHYQELRRILGPFKLIGSVDHDYTKSGASGISGAIPTEVLNVGHKYIEYPMSYAALWLEIKDGKLVNHQPEEYYEYPDGFTYSEGGGLEAVTRPLDEGPMKNPPSTYNPYFDS